MSLTLGFAGDPHIGVFTRVFEDIAVIPPETPQEMRDAFQEDLGVDLVATHIQGTHIIGSLLAGNSRGLVVSGLVVEDERAALEEHREVMLLEGSMNAAGNVILVKNKIIC